MSYWLILSIRIECFYCVIHFIFFLKLCFNINIHLFNTSIWRIRSQLSTDDIQRLFLFVIWLKLWWTGYYFRTKFPNRCVHLLTCKWTIWWSWDRICKRIISKLFIIILLMLLNRRCKLLDMVLSISLLFILVLRLTLH